MKKLKKWLKENDITQQDFADMLGVTFKTVNIILNGHQKAVMSDTLEKMHLISGIPYDVLIDDLKE